MDDDKEFFIQNFYKTDKILRFASIDATIRAATLYKESSLNEVSYFFIEMRNDDFIGFKSKTENLFFVCSGVPLDTASVDRWNSLLSDNFDMADLVNRNLWFYA